MHLRRQIAALGAVAAACAAGAPTALANDFEEVYRDFKKTGTIHPCRFSEQDLDNASKQVPPDIEQYVPSFLDALENARETRDECGGKRPAAAAPAPAPPPVRPPSDPAAPAPAGEAPAAGGTATPPAPTPVARPSVSGVPSPPGAKGREPATPAPVWILAAIAALAALAALGAAAAWRLGWSPAWLASLRGSFAEAGERFSDFGFEFWDWVRTGR